jgi:hypothetical protein
MVLILPVVANPAFVHTDAMFPRGYAPSSTATLVDNPHYGSFSSNRSSRIATLRNARSTSVDSPYSMADRQAHRNGGDPNEYDGLTGMDTRNPARSAARGSAMPSGFNNPTYEFGANRGVYSTVNELV